MASKNPPLGIRTRERLWSIASYVICLLGTIVLFSGICRYGETMASPPLPAEGPLTPTSSPPALLQVLIALVAVLVVGQIVGRVVGYLGQPPVIGEVIAGILLGPSLLGPERSAYILPPAVAPMLAIIAQLGVILYMFLVGLELNAELLRGRLHATVVTSHVSIVVPFLLGGVLALGFYSTLASPSVRFTSFALFMGVAISITAFPVLARILTDRNLAQTELGVVALSCAAIDDVTAWALLAFVVGVAQAQVGGAFLVIGGTVLFVVFMAACGRPLVGWLSRRWEATHSSRDTVRWLFVAVLLSALATEAIGIHAIFGAFILGAMIPHNSAVARSLIQQVQHVVTVLLLPSFFALTGMQTRIDLLNTGWDWLLCLVIIVVATAGKFGGTVLAARLTGMPWREAAMLGALMNTRGLMELIVLNIGLQLNVISPRLFAMMVMMALTTTMATSPLLAWLKPNGLPQSTEANLLSSEGNT